MRKHLLAIAVILTAATGCDNVAWGGIEVELRPPPISDTAAATANTVDDTVAVVKVPGPLLLAGERTGERADFVIVGELLAARLSPFPDPDVPSDATRLAELSTPGSEWVVYSEGVRVGRMTVEATSPAEPYCGDRLTLSGTVELVPSAATAVRLLALPSTDGEIDPYGAYQQHADVYDQRVATLQIAGEAIPRYGESWPAGGVLSLREDIQAFQPADASAPWVAATFVNQDLLGVASPGQGAYSLFVVARPEAGGELAEAFTWFRSVESEGKAIPQYHDHLDWDDDGQDEILLDVFGANRRWFATLDRLDGRLIRAFEDPCGSGAAPSN